MAGLQHCASHGGVIQSWGWLPKVKALGHSRHPTSTKLSFSKFLERIIYNRLVHYLQCLNILCDNQYGFRKDHSTSFAIIDLYDKISTAFDQGEFAIGLFVDLSKAFDMVDHAILFDKLEYYGIRGLALDWIKNYFSNRTQYVSLVEFPKDPSLDLFSS